MRHSVWFCWTRYENIFLSISTWDKWKSMHLLLNICVASARYQLQIYVATWLVRIKRLCLSVCVLNLFGYDNAYSIDSSSHKHTHTQTMFGQWIASSGNCNGMRMWYGKQFFTNQIYVSTSYVPLHYIICAHLALTDAVDVRRFSSLS